MAHARRKFVEVAESFPDEVAFVLETLRQVYLHDAEARQRELSPDERLALHQERSQPLMAALEGWLEDQIEERKVEPNSSLGESIVYMRKHWAGLTLFLREPGAPLDNKFCERVLKTAILHRKNAMFYKTPNGARVGDVFMSLIHTAELCGADPFDCLVGLQRHHERVADAPGDWMPWSFAATLEKIGAAAASQ
ncbi:MAG: transposase [Planctomycetes bacterium]|nr:transposase [Planctomycetota bacterium]